MDRDRAVGTLTDRELSSWKEIASYLGVSVRTAQVWERERGLPVRRLPGPRSPVSTSVGELERWKRSAQTAGPDASPEPAGARVQVQEPARSRTRLLPLAGALLLLGILGAAVLDRNLHSVPRSFRMERDALVILNDRGRELWRKSFPALDLEEYPGDARASIWFGGLGGKGDTEVLFVPRHGAAAGPLLCYSSSGQERWRFLPQPVLHTRREEFLPPFRIDWFVVEPVGPRGSLRVIVGSRHHESYPMQIALLGPDGRLLREYWHSGYFNKFFVEDLNGDGRLEIILGGVSNGSNAATLVVLDPADFGGASVEENPDYQLLGFSPGVEKARLLFPRTCFGKALHEPFNAVTDIETEQPGIAVGVAEQLVPLASAVIHYHLTGHLAVRQIDASSLFEAVHAQLRAAGQLDHDYSPQELDKLDPIKYLVNRMAPLRQPSH